MARPGPFPTGGYSRERSAVPHEDLCGQPDAPGEGGVTQGGAV